jgi:hypothetical protein
MGMLVLPAQMSSKSGAIAAVTGAHMGKEPAAGASMPDKVQADLQYKEQRLSTLAAAAQVGLLCWTHSVSGWVRILTKTLVQLYFFLAFFGFF